MAIPVFIFKIQRGLHMKLKTGMKNVLVTVTLLLVAATAQAVEFRGVVGFGMDFGGDVLLSGTYSDGSTWEAKANQGLVLNGGVVMVTGDFETQATVGYKFGGPQAKNGSVTFDEMPVELIEFYRTSIIRMGIGISYLNSPKLVVDLPSGTVNGTYKFDNSLAYVAQIGWAPEKSPFSIDLRYTMAKLKASGVANAQDVNGNVVGLYMSYFF
jgi:hypothetical protein